MFKKVAIVGVLVLVRMAWAATPATVDVDVDKPGIAISPMLNGLMTEEINHAFDGGLYAELIQNRTLQDNADQPAHWSLVQNNDKGDAKIALDRSNPVNPALPVSLRIDLANGRAGAANDGYWGIPVRPDTKYIATFFAKSGGGFSGTLTAALVGDNATPFAQSQSEPLTSDWKKYTVTLTTGHDVTPTVHAKFVLFGEGTGTFWLSNVSLFPPTYMDRANGLRVDLMEKMAAMHPSFLRMPGGNYLEGDTFPTRFDWKKMIGPVEDRPGHMGCWSYRSSDGFGLPEFLTWCEQLKMEPILAVFAGYTLKHDYVPAGPKLQQYVDEALEEIEYCTGDASTTWGKKRAEDGHTKPFKIRYIEIGNEDWFDRSGSYEGRFAQFYDAIKAKYPELQLVATTKVKSRKPDMIDDHYYRSARQMEFDEHHYDKTDRNGPKIFVGEWATQEGRPTPDLNAALADAAWLMGLERNSDIVVMQCYAPLFVNVNPHASQWPTNLIGYDALNSFGSPSYWMQVMFGQNKGDVVLPTALTVTPKVAATEPVPHGAIGVGTWHTSAEYKDIVVTHDDQTLFTADLSKDTSGWKISGGRWNTQDSAIKQTLENATCMATAGDANWTDYTVTLKARKISGTEGFLVLFHAQDRDNFLWWNIGGWRNDHTGVQGTYDGSRQDIGQPAAVTVDTGRWYDIKVDVQGRHIRCFLDGKLISDVTEEPVPVRTPVFAEASYIKGSGEVVLKLVNASTDDVDMAINLRGAKQVAGGKAIVLSGSPSDQNTIDNPEKVVPKEEPLAATGSTFQRNLPAHSLTLLRVKAGE